MGEFIGIYIYVCAVVHWGGLVCLGLYQNVLCGCRCQKLCGVWLSGMTCGWRYALGGSYLGWGWGDAAPCYGEGRLTLISFKSLLAVSTDMITSTLAPRGQRAFPVGSVTRAGS